MAYGYYRSIEINAAAVGANETNFPVALVLTDGAFRAFLANITQSIGRAETTLDAGQESDWLHRYWVIIHPYWPKAES